MCLTLGALAELEAAFGDEDMLALAMRFEAGRISARDAVRIIGAGLRGAGHDVADDDVARMANEGGAAGFIDVVARLLTCDVRRPSRQVEAVSARGGRLRVTAALSLGRRDGGCRSGCYGSSRARSGA